MEGGTETCEECKQTVGFTTLWLQFLSGPFKFTPAQQSQRSMGQGSYVDHQLYVLFLPEQ